MRFGLPLLLASLALLLHARPVLAQADATASKLVKAQVSGRTVYLGEPFTYSVRVESLEDPQLIPLKSDAFEVNGPSGPSLSQNMFIVNGRVNASSSLSYRYVLTAREAGEFTIPPAVVEANGKRYRSEAIAIKVVGPTNSDLFKLSARVSPQKLYPMQKFDVEITVDFRGLEKPVADVSPLSLLRSNPRLAIPWFRDANIPEGIVPLAELDLRSARSRDGSGFSIPQAPSYSIFSRREAFLPHVETLQLPVVSDEKQKEQDEGGNDDDAAEQSQTWYRYKLLRSFFASRTGTFELGRGSLQGQLIASVKDGRGSLESAFGLTDPVTIEVTPLPLDSRPDSWIGVIGDLDVETEIIPATARVGEPLTLKLTLTGTGSLKDAFPPNLSTDENISKQFRIYEPTSKPTRSGRVFTYSIRAKEAGALSFPPLELTWFDPLRGEYVTGNTSPIGLEIGESESLMSDEIVNPASAFGSGQNTDADAGSIGMAANLTSLTNESVQPTRWLAAWGTLTAVFSLLWFAVGREASVRSMNRARKADCLIAARRQLDESLQLLKDGQQTQGLTRVRESITSVVRGMTGSDAEGLTTEDVLQHLAAAAIDSELANQTNELLESLDAARYGGSDAAADVSQSARDLVPRLIAAAKKSEQTA